MRAGARRSRPLRQLVIAAAATTLFLIAYYWGNQYKRTDSSPPVVEAMLVRPAPSIEDFELRGSNGQASKAKDLHDHWTLLAFGNPGRASGHLAATRLIEIHNRLASDPELQSMLQLLVVTSHGDSGLAHDFRGLSPVLKILSGTAEDVAQLRTSVGAPENDHAAAPPDEAPIYLIGPKGRLIALFAGAQGPTSIASDLSTIAKHPDAPQPADD